MNRYLLACFTVILGVGLIFGGLPSVFAAEEDFTLEEITVTAEKRESNVQKTSISITAVSGEEIAEKAQNTPQEILKQLTGLAVAEYTQGQTPYIRGIGGTGGGATGVVVDDVYTGSARVFTSGMYDMERVEVLRGPQGTLYGRNTLAGNINLVSRKPTTDKFELLGNIQMGDYNLKHFDGAVNSPISEKWALRVAFMREMRDGYLSNGANDMNLFGVRTKLLYKPNDKFSVLAIYDYSWERDHGTNGVPITGVGLPPSGFMAWRDPTLPTTGWVLPAGADEWTQDEWHNLLGLLFVKRSQYTLKIEWDLGWGALTIIPAQTEQYSFNVDDKLAGTGFTAAYGSQEGDQIQKSLEMRLASPAESSFIWLVGYYFDTPESGLPSTTTREPWTYTTDNSWHWATTSSPRKTHAFFGQATYPLTDRFRLTGGLRYNIDITKMKYAYGNANVPTDDSLYPQTGGTGVFKSGWLDYKKNINALTWKINTEFDIKEDSMLYAQISTGFKAGGLTSTAPPTEYKAEVLTSYELGSKNRFMDGRMQLNLAAYYYEYKDMQGSFWEAGKVAIGTDVRSTGTAVVIRNAGVAKHKGLEMDFNYRLAMNDKVSMSFAYVDAYFGKYQVMPSMMNGLKEPFELTGRPIASTPKWEGSLGYDHTWIIDNGASVTGSLFTKISAGYYTTAEQYLVGNWQDGYHRSDFQLFYDSPSGIWNASVWIKNLENHAQTQFIVPYNRKFVSNPRTFGVNFSVKF
jgi:iron complex outermembrane recepter protein